MVKIVLPEPSYILKVIKLIFELSCAVQSAALTLDIGLIFSLNIVML